MLEYTWIKTQKFKLSQPPERFKNLWKKIGKDAVRLDMLFSVHRGIWTGAPHIYVVSEKKVMDLNLEKIPLRRIIRGKDIKPFGFYWKGLYLIYATRRLYPNFLEEYKNIAKWLTQYKLILERRTAVFTWNREWWELEDPLDPKIFEQPKIISPLFARQQTFAYDNSATYYLLDTVTIIRPWLSSDEKKLYAENWKKVNEPDLNIDNFCESGESEIKLFRSIEEVMLYTVAILNSEVLEFYFKLYAPRLIKRGRKPKKGRWFSYMPPYVNILPIKFAERSHRYKIIELAKKISKLANNLLIESDQFKKDHLESELGFLVHELNENIFDVYKIDDDERIAIEAYIYKKR